MKRTNASGSIANQFTDGNPTSGIPATVLEQTWLNNVQEEIAYVIEQAGITLNGAVTTQLRTAIAAMITAGAAQPDASTTVKGIVQLATDAEVLTGTSTTKVPSVLSMKRHQGSAKAWASYSQATNTIGDSYNVSSFTDTGIGTGNMNFTNNMLNTSYAAAGMGSGAASLVTCDAAITTYIQYRTADSRSAAVADVNMLLVVHGRLA